jgi:MFS family permease
MVTRSADRDLVLLAGGQAISVAGDSAALVALLLRLRPDGSGWVAALLAAELIPFVVLASVSGRIVDAVESRRVLLVALVGQAAVAVPLAFVSAPAGTVALFAALNAFATLVRPATSALVPAATGANGAARGYAWLATGAGLGWIVGPALGGIVTGTLGATAALLGDAGTFALLAGAVALVRARRRVGEHAHEDSARGGFALLWRAPVLRSALVTSGVATACAVVDNVAAPFRFVDQLGTSSSGYGLYLTVWGTGALLGVQVLPRLSAPRHPAALAAGNLLMGLAICGVGLAPTFVVALVAAIFGGFGNGLVNVTLNAVVAAQTPEAQHGRAFAAAGASIQTSVGAGTAVGAPLVAAFGAGHAMAGAGALAALTTLVAAPWLSRPPRSTELG